MLALAAFQISLPVGDDLPETVGLAVRRPVLVTAPATTDYPGIVERPLFTPGRRAEAEPAQVEDAGAYTIVGIGTAQGAATALLRAPDGTALRVLPGDIVGDWEVIAIEPTRVTLVRGDERLVLQIEKGTP